MLVSNIIIAFNDTIVRIIIYPNSFSRCKRLSSDSTFSYSSFSRQTQLKQFHFVDGVFASESIVTDELIVCKDALLFKQLHELQIFSKTLNRLDVYTWK